MGCDVIHVDISTSVRGRLYSDSHWGIVAMPRDIMLRLFIYWIYSSIPIPSFLSYLPVLVAFLSSPNLETGKCENDDDDMYPS